MALLPVGAWLLLPLEQRFPPPVTMPERVDGILVLGGTVIPGLSVYYDTPQINDSGERLTEAVRLARLYPQARLAYTGGSGNPWAQEFKEAPHVRRFWADLGLDTEKILFEDQSRNTWENAVFSKEMLNPRPGEVWLLVTSAAHMPRSVGIFRKVGWPVLPWPVDYQLTPGAVQEMPLSLRLGLSNCEYAVREYIGLLAYYLMGRTDALFPAPAPGMPSSKRSPESGLDEPG